MLHFVMVHFSELHKNSQYKEAYTFNENMPQSQLFFCLGKFCNRNKTHKLSKKKEKEKMVRTQQSLTFQFDLSNDVFFSEINLVSMKCLV